MVETFSSFVLQYQTNPLYCGLTLESYLSKVKKKVFLVTNDVSDPILNTIQFLKVCTMTSFIINLIPEPGEGRGLGGGRTSKNEEQRNPPRRINICKNQSRHMKAGSMKMIYANFQLPPYLCQGLPSGYFVVSVATNDLSLAWFWQVIISNKYHTMIFRHKC
ncbi:unnamed protein product [Meganyctiphanes norvegica]|uniref:Uncharacterized protein n=1 Tax=Meganyctiphanes norvegica TaxID=48144 RepID=A0AAV2SR28_MEGNR